jgi:hypothetical protein
MKGRLMSENQKQRWTATPADVAEIRDRIADWRQNRRKLSPMPEDLWVSAESLAHKHGVYQMSRELGRNYQSLKYRVTQRQTTADGAVPAGDFIELDGVRFLEAPEPAEVALELSDAEGGRLSLRLTGRSELDWAGVVDAFLRRRA